jgi:hypothetical protein
VWLTPDARGYVDSSNLYAYAGGEPINRRDPTGEAATVGPDGTIHGVASWGRYTITSDEAHRDPVAVLRILESDEDLDKEGQENIMMAAGLPIPYSSACRPEIGERCWQPQRRGPREYLRPPPCDASDFFVGLVVPSNYEPTSRCMQAGHATAQGVAIIVARRAAPANRGIANPLPTLNNPMPGPPQINGGPFKTTVGRSYPRGMGVVNGSKGTTHNLNVRLRDANGKVVGSWREISGEMTPEQLAMAMRRGTNSAHTEPKALTRVNLQPGQTLEMTGQRSPCSSSCSGILETAARESGATIIYRWRENGRTMTMVFPQPR